MASSKRPSGKRFTSVYRARGEPTDESPKFRRRLAHRLSEIDSNSFVSSLRSETGYPISFSAGSSWWLEFIENLPLDELLDFLTISIEVLLSLRFNQEAVSFRTFVTRAMNEENLTFEMDDFGGVHYRVDRAFQDQKRAALEALNDGDALAARKAFEGSQLALSSHPADTLSAVRLAFDAVENLFKIRFGTSRLGAGEIKSKMNDLANGEGARASHAARRINSAFAEWVNACHQYRHAAGEPDPSPPPRWLAVAIVDGAATYIRYLRKDWPGAGRT